MAIDMRRLGTGLLAAIVLAAMLIGLAGCGGSGSSGFDAVASEASAVQHVIDSGDCTQFGEQTFCASGVESPVEPFEGALVKIQQPVDSPLICTGSEFAEQCIAPLAFTTEGFDEPSSLLAAVSETEAGPWTLAAVEVIESVEGGPRTVSIAVPGDTGDREPSQLIAAVLVYDGTPPENLPLVSAQLADFQVDLVYVSQRLVIVVPR
jgi:hypothetical protein